MNKKYLMIIAVGAAILTVVVAAYFYNRKHQQIDLPTESLATVEVQPTTNNQQPTTAVTTTSRNEAVGIKDRTLKKNSFTILVPAGWAEVNYMAGATIVANPNEENLDPVLKKSGFKSYFSVTRDAMKGKTWEQATLYVKSIVDASSPIDYATDRDGTTLGIASHFWEADLARDGTKFKVLIYAVRGKGDDLWILTFNTGASMWPAYTRLASKIFDSFKLI